MLTIKILQHGILEVSVEDLEGTESKTVKVVGFTDTLLLQLIANSCCIVSIQLNGKGTVKLTPSSTTIHNCHDEKLRNLLKTIISRQLVQI